MENNSTGAIVVGGGDGGGGISFNEKMESLAVWLGTSVASAFFSSLERCSCVNLSTSDSDDENDDEAKDRPFIPSAAALDCAPADKLPV